MSNTNLKSVKEEAMDSASSEGGGNQATPNGSEAENEAAALPVKLAGDALEELLEQMEEYAPTIPDAVTGYYLNRSGFEASDPRLVRLISISAQKFISDIANDALQHCKMRGSGQSSKKSVKDKRYTLTMEDLSPALTDHGINVKKPYYFT
ncbi:transcription initiation factor TFIID subunit 10 [Strongylocentrotus purpuratus]|uniref:Transcription initiation factor TFIID subunit 10 n=1 Tax=Strongylocentrotus purpuratus TaxID=7668 RepID=A0A7M7FZY0_STRPU|nr:transcription initiation factor TFIID subunit 10 [Strongylocentrotus purpuratus]|eukprot:XP_011683264.1 PREDICTED: transcription initiation factor TFIID subunit 10 isoform X1 [Strongylocentrotus purpuratus]